MGRVICKSLSKSYDIIATYNKTNLSKNFMKSLEGKNNLFYKCNLENEKDIRGLIKKIKKKYKRLDILINNASYTKNLTKNYILNPDKRIIKKIMNTNFYSTYFITSEAIKLMLKSKILEKKNVIFILSNSLKNPLMHQTYFIHAQSRQQKL